MVAAIILAEQRDQSQLEDAKDYTAAASVKQANTSIGLGQVVISTAQRNDLFSDLIDAETKSKLSHNDYARLLADDTVNIFATAKYIRSVADKAAAAPPEVQSRFKNSFQELISANSKKIRQRGHKLTFKHLDQNIPLLLGTCRSRRRSRPLLTVPAGVTLLAKPIRM